MQIELTILRNLIQNEQYARKVIPFINDRYFTQASDKIVFNLVDEFINKYNALPSVSALKLEADKLVLSASEAQSVFDLVESLKVAAPENMDWLVESTENFCREKAIYNALMDSIEILNDQKKGIDKGSIPKLLTDALAVTFDPNVGHDYFGQANERFEYYHRAIEKMPFDLEYFNKITKGGIPRKTLNIVLAGTNVGKSLFMGHVAAAALRDGKNVLYITLELAEEEISKRLDANLLDITMDELMALPKEIYDARIAKVRKKTDGQLIVKEYPTASANVNHFRALLNELYLKKNFRPDVIFVDYLNICTSSRLKPGGVVNSYMYVKAIAEELRGLAVEFNVPVWSATQTNRAGFDNSDVDLTNTSESFGLPATADFMFALINSEELEALSQLMVKQLKSRYNETSTNKKFVIGIDRQRMKLYDVGQDAQKGISDSGQENDEPEKVEKKNKFKQLRT